jgi:hypothetical protein
MSKRRWGLGLLTAAIAVIGFAGASARAADLIVTKAPPPQPEPTLDIHGFVDVSFKNDYITPRGLLVTNTGLTTQVLSGLVLDLYKDRAGFINKVDVVAGVWNDIWSEQHNPTVGAWNEFDWFAGVDVVFAQNWKFSAQFVQFLSPPGNFRAESNGDFTLSYSDKWTGWPITFNPYVKLWWAMDGDSNVVVGKQGDTYYVEFGAVPTLDLSKQAFPVVFTAPTWVSVGPSDYWNRGVTGCGVSALTPCALSNAGVFSTGLKATVPVTIIPARFGHWYVDGGVQYYYLINDSLLLAQTLTGTASSYATAHRDVGLVFAGFGVGF